jgi:hypothetical protein
MRYRASPTLGILTSPYVNCGVQSPVPSHPRAWPGWLGDPRRTGDAFLFQRLAEMMCKFTVGGRKWPRGTCTRRSLRGLGGLCGLIAACRLEHEAASAEDKWVSKSLVRRGRLPCSQLKTRTSTSTC